MNGPGTPGVRPAGRRLRLSGTGDAPRARGWLHLAALVVALPAAVVLVWRGGPGDGVAVYALALVGLFAVSASYHLCPWTPASRRRMRLIDHQMIFVFIAAATTPYCLLAVPGTLADVVLGLVWAGARRRRRGCRRALRRQPAGHLDRLHSARLARRVHLA